MKNIYSTPDIKIVAFSSEDVIKTSGLETGVQYNSNDWGAGGSWMNGASWNN